MASGQQVIKPLGHKAYGSIPHLPGSRLGPADHHCSPGQVHIATVKTRDKHDMVIVQEKLDGSCCAVANIEGEIIALGRAGYPAKSSEYPVHHVFAAWVKEHEDQFSGLLYPGERLIGEFLAQAIGTRYELFHDPFVAFDLMVGSKRLSYRSFFKRVYPAGFTIPRVIAWQAAAYPLEEAILQIQDSGHGAIDPVEGVIYRVERKDEVDFLCKYVRHDKEDGKYFPERNGGKTTWNIDVSKYLTNPI